MTSTKPISESNTDQFKAWDGDEGAHFADHADQYDASLGAHHERLMGAAGVVATDNVLDIGCGAGATTCDAARLAPNGRHLGIDLSGPLLAVARERAATRGLTNLDFVQADAQVYPFEARGFDVALSRMGAMFFGEQVEAFINIGSALKPGARLVLLTWQGFAENEWLQQFRQIMSAGRDMPGPRPPNQPGPFALSEPHHIQDVLTSAGFDGVHCDALRLPIYFGPDVATAEDLLLGQLGWMLEGLDNDTRERTVQQLHNNLTEHMTPDGVAYGSATWLITATRR